MTAINLPPTAALFHTLDETDQLQHAHQLVGRDVLVTLHPGRAAPELLRWAGGPELAATLVAVAFRVERGRPLLILSTRRDDVPVAITTYWVRGLTAAPPAVAR